MKIHNVYNISLKDIKKKWYIIDAENKSLGKVAAKAAYILRGKNKPIYTPHLDTGDNVVIINAAKAKMTGNKAEDKIYYHYSGYPGGMSGVSYEKLLVKKPCYPMELAIKGMLPKGPLGRELFRNLRVYRDANYKETSQKPEVVEKL